jgi:hypothetical protein
MTIISSIKVKPCWYFFMVYPLGVMINFTCPARPAFGPSGSRAMTHEQKNIRRLRAHQAN